MVISKFLCQSSDLCCWKRTFVLNSANGIIASRDKLFAHQLLSDAHIGIPLTAFASSPKVTKEIINLAGGAPVVVKLLQSTQGRGVVLAETWKAVESLVDAFRGLDANCLVRQFVPEASGADVQIFCDWKQSCWSDPPQSR